MRGAYTCSYPKARLEPNESKGFRAIVGAPLRSAPMSDSKAIVDVMQPGPDMRIADPACGTGGFFLTAASYVLAHLSLDPDQRRHMQHGLITGWEIVDSTARLCAMNLLLHGIEGPDAKSPIHVDDALRADPGERFDDMVLTNPPFGRKSSVQVVTTEGKAERQSLTVVRDDFWASTSNKQLNFVQHVRTLLRLPTGIFYAQGVKANVVFFTRKPGSDVAATRDLWVDDLRTNLHFTLKTNRLKRSDLDDFVAAFKPGARHERVESERFQRFTYDELVARDKASLDVFWLRDESLEDTDSLPPPGVLAAEIVEDLQAALAELTELADSLAAVGVGTDGDA